MAKLFKSKNGETVADFDLFEARLQDDISRGEIPVRRLVAELYGGFVIEPEAGEEMPLSEFGVSIPGTVGEVASVAELAKSHPVTKYTANTPAGVVTLYNSTEFIAAVKAEISNRLLTNKK